MKGDRDGTFIINESMNKNGCRVKRKSYRQKERNLNWAEQRMYTKQKLDN